MWQLWKSIGVAPVASATVFYHLLIGHFDVEHDGDVIRLDAIDQRRDPVAADASVSAEQPGNAA
ncbi:MAG: hypothetical protein R2881_08855 [Eubacteriales bacterium]